MPARNTPPHRAHLPAVASKGRAGYLRLQLKVYLTSMKIYLFAQYPIHHTPILLLNSAVATHSRRLDPVPAGFSDKINNEQSAPLPHSAPSMGERSGAFAWLQPSSLLAPYLGCRGLGLCAGCRAGLREQWWLWRGCVEQSGGGVGRAVGGGSQSGYHELDGGWRVGALRGWGEGGVGEFRR